MRTLDKIFISAAIGIMAIAATSCQKDSTLYYGNLTMGNVKEGRFVSDQGNIFNVVDQTCLGQLDTMKRAIMVCDVLNATEGKANEYDIRLTQLSSVLTKTPLSVAEAAEGDAAVKNPVLIDRLWFSGGYLNMYVVVPFDRTKNVKHLINLVYSHDDNGDPVMELRHNAFSDLRDDTNVNMVLGGSYVSFPILDIIGGDSAKITIKNLWYEVAGSAYLSTEKEYIFEYDWKREGFEHVPTDIAVKSFSNIQ